MVCGCPHEFVRWHIHHLCTSAGYRPRSACKCTRQVKAWWLDSCVWHKGLVHHESLILGISSLSCDIDGGQCRIKVMFRVLQHPDPQFWGSAIGGSGKFLCAVYNWNRQKYIRTYAKITKAICSRSKLEAEIRELMYDNGTRPETVLDTRECFRVGVFLVILDSLIATLNEQLSAYQVVSNMSGFLGWLQDIPPAEVVTAAQVLIMMTYPEDLESDQSSGLTHFVKFVVTIGTDKLQNCQGAGVKSSRELLMFLLLHEQQLMQTFPDDESMLCVYLSLMVSHCSGEWTFSKMGVN